MKKPLIEIRNLNKTYLKGKQNITAVHSLSFDIFLKETFGLVGESGCGKSTTGRCLLRLEEPTCGSISYEGDNILEFNREKLLLFRRKAQIIFQDPYASLNPRLSALDTIAEPMRIHRLAQEGEIPQKVAHLLDLVGLSRTSLHRFPHEFSGGQRQRIGIARALAVNPSFIICDEPISALDVSVQAQIVNLLQDLQKEMGLTYLFIAHDLSMVKYISDRIAVMYLGHLVELSTAEDLYKSPLHPYTQALLSSICIPDPVIEKKRTHIPLQGEVPSPLQVLQGCPFASRCPQTQAICHEKKPPLKEIQPGHSVACHLITVN
ncbi:MAG: ABC transporter ATP-binding protein [Chlamydiales bacterium]|nr:ABC transporter ATP-binding protein [Chlamydiales bacterium]